MIFRKITTLCTALAIASIAPMVSAAPAAPAKLASPSQARLTVAVVDVPKVLKDSTAAKGAIEMLQAKRNSFQKEIDQKEQELRKKAAELEKQKSVLSAEAFKKKQDLFQKDVAAVQQSVQQKRASLEATYNASLKQVRDQIIQIIAELAKEKRFDLAVPSAQVLYAQSQIDISKEVLTRLNQRLPKVKVDQKKK